jgi:hypothetical protein
MTVLPTREIPPVTFIYLRLNRSRFAPQQRPDRTRLPGTFELAAVGSAYEASLCEYRVDNQEIRKTWSLNILSFKRFNVGDHYTSLVGDVWGLQKCITCKALEINYIAQD